MGLVLCFSVAGYGDVTYMSLSSWQYPWYYAAAVDVFLLLVLWIFDATSWKMSSLIMLRRACVAILVVFAGIACLLATKVYPFAPLQFGLLLIPAFAFGVRQLALRELRPATYMGRLSACLTAVAALLFFYFILWVFALPPPPRRFETGWHKDWKNLWGGGSANTQRIK